MEKNLPPAHGSLPSEEPLLQDGLPRGEGDAVVPGPQNPPTRAALEESQAGTGAHRSLGAGCLRNRGAVLASVALCAGLAFVAG